MFYSASKAPPAVFHAIHNLLVTLTLLPVEVLQESKWNDPLQCFLAVYALREEKAFLEPQQVTKLLAKCKYILRSIVFWQSVMNMENFGDDFQK